MSSQSGLWRDRKLPGSSRSLRQACIRGRMPFSSIMTRLQAYTRGFSHTPRHWSEHFKRQVTLSTRIVTKSSLSTPENMPDNVTRSIMGAHGEGNTQYADFVAHRLQSTAVAFHAPIKMNKIHLSGNRHKYRNKCKHVNSTKADMHLLRQLYMTMHVRERNSDRLFEVENADCPPSLSKHGGLRSDQKSDLLSCLEVERPSDFDEADAKLIDCAHMVHFLGRMRASSHSVTMPLRG